MGFAHCAGAMFCITLHFAMMCLLSSGVHAGDSTVAVPTSLEDK
jgi:hypothetical protein